MSNLPMMISGATVIFLNNHRQINTGRLEERKGYWRQKHEAIQPGNLSPLLSFNLKFPLDIENRLL
jgi:hypothetical protein